MLLRFTCYTCLLLCIGLWCCPTLSTAQTLPLPEEDHLRDFQEILSQPGVRNRRQSRGIEVRHEMNGGFDWSFQGETQRVRLANNTVAKLKVPLLNKPAWKVLLGYEWNTENYYFDDLNDLGNSNIWTDIGARRLKTNKFSAYITHSIDERHYLSGRIRVSSNGNYEGWVDFSAPYRTYSAIALYGTKPHENKEWGFGVTLSQNELRTLALPFLLYNITWNDRWGLESALPGAAFIRRSFPDNSSLLAGMEFDSKFYAIGSGVSPLPGDGEPTFLLNNNGLRAIVHYEHKLTGWIWAYGQAGYFMPVQSEITYRNQLDEQLTADMGGRPLLRLGVFLSPPRELMRGQVPTRQAEVVE